MWRGNEICVPYSKCLCNKFNGWPSLFLCWSSNFGSDADGTPIQNIEVRMALGRMTGQIWVKKSDALLRIPRSRMHALLNHWPFVYITLFTVSVMYRHLESERNWVGWARFFCAFSTTVADEPVSAWIVWFKTHWGRDKLAAIFRTTLWNAFSWMKIYTLRLIFHWSLFLRFQLTIFQHWFR